MSNGIGRLQSNKRSELETKEAAESCDHLKGCEATSEAATAEKGGCQGSE